VWLWVWWVEGVVLWFLFCSFAFGVGVWGGNGLVMLVGMGWVLVVGGGVLDVDLFFVKRGLGLFELVGLLGFSFGRKVLLCLVWCLFGVWER